MAVRFPVVKTKRKEINYFLIKSVRYFIIWFQFS